MTTDNIERNDDFGKLIQKGGLEIPDINFEDKVMDRILLAGVKKKSEKKNIRLSWIFLIISCILFPLSYMALGMINWESTAIIGEHIDKISKSISLSGVVVFSIIVFYQLDNLLRLTIKGRRLA